MIIIMCLIRMHISAGFLERGPSPTAFTAGNRVAIVFPTPVGAWIKSFFFRSIVLYTDTARSLETHLAQAMCYAYMYASQKELEEIGVQMTYCHMRVNPLQHISCFRDTSA